MFNSYSYLYPYYRFAPVSYYGGAGWGSYSNYPGYLGYANYGSNFIGSSIANNELINTGIATGVSQIANPITIW